MSIQWRRAEANLDLPSNSLAPASFAMPCTYEHPRAALAVDCVVFGLDETDLKVLLIQRKLTPFQHAWALPGGFVRLDETVDEAAQRELKEEAGVDDVYLEEHHTVGVPGRGAAEPGQRHSG